MLQQVGVLGAALFGALVTYLVAIRRASGRIATTEASTLWEAAEQMREEYREQIAVLNEVVKGLRDRIVHLERENDRLRAENDKLQQRLERVENGD